MARPLRLLAISLVLILSTALPWLVTTLLTDIFAGLAVLSFFILVVHGERTSTIEKCSLFALMAFAVASHSATLAVLFGLSCIGWIARPFLRGRLAVAGLVQGSLTIVAGAAMLVSANFALSGQAAWTPGGYGVAFGRAAGRHRRALFAGALSATEAETLSLSRSAAGHRRSVSVGQQHVQHARPLQGPERRNGLHRAAFARRISGLAG
jgi:hypothetical protein